MFDRSAWLYDLVYSHKDYAAEARWIQDAVRSRLPAATSLLDVACGTGQHLEHLRDEFRCQGVDINPEYVAIARERTGLPIHLGSMEDMAEIGDRFDAVICMFSSIGYTDNLTAAIAAMAKHLNPDGVLTVEPWFTTEGWTSGTVQVLDHQDGSTRVVRMSYSGAAGNQSIIDMHYLVGTPAGIEHFSERHHMTLFTLDEYRRAFTDAGLTFETDRPGPFGRGALIGRTSPQGSERTATGGHLAHRVD